MDPGIAPETALILNRAVTAASAASLFGAPALLARLAPGGIEQALKSKLASPIRTAAAVLAVSALIALPLHAAIVAETWAGATDFAQLGRLARDTATGNVMLVRIALALAVLWAARRWHENIKATALLSGLFIASFAFTGHTALHEGSLRAAHQLNHAIHVLAGSFWLGALLPLALAAGLLAKPHVREPAARLLHSFSNAGLAAVTLVVATGAINTALILGHVPSDWSATYQLLLFAKIACVAAMLALAAVNRFFLVPRAESNANSTALQFSILAECALGAAVLALVAVFGTLEPV